MSERNFRCITSMNKKVSEAYDSEFLKKKFYHSFNVKVFPSSKYHKERDSAYTDLNNNTKNVIYL